MRIYLTTIVVLLTALYGCGTLDQAAINERSKSDETKQPASADLVGSANTQDPYYVLVHGGGPYWLANMNKFARMMQRRGVASNRIIKLRYQYNADLDSINADLISQFNQPMIADNPHIVITHSLGDFVGLRALMGSDAHPNTQKFIAMAGVANGQNRALTDCAFCPPYLETLAPYQNDFVMDTWAEFEDELAELDHCAIYSTKDRLVNDPYNSGVFEFSESAEYRDLSHVDFIKRPRVLDRIEDACGIDLK